MTGTPSRPQHFFSPLFPTPNLVHGRLQMWSGGKPESLPGDLTHRPGGEADSEYNFFFLSLFFSSGSCPHTHSRRSQTQR